MKISLFENQKSQIFHYKPKILVKEKWPVKMNLFLAISLCTPAEFDYYYKALLQAADDLHHL